MFSRIILWITSLLPILYMGFIWYLSSYPSDAIIHTGLTWDGLLKEGLHLVEFGALYVLLFLALLARGKVSVGLCIIAAIISATYGIVDELHQHFVPGRSATLTDLIKDITGVAVAWYFMGRLYFQGHNSRLGLLLRWLESCLQPGDAAKQVGKGTSSSLKVDNK